jgi:hypothetical protein
LTDSTTFARVQIILKKPPSKVRQAARHVDQKKEKSHSRLNFVSHPPGFGQAVFGGDVNPGALL